jgi:hypothetical protein
VTIRSQAGLQAMEAEKICNYSANTNIIISKEYVGKYFSSVIRVTRADTQVRPYITTVHP